MARERADSFISRFLFRGSKEREQEAVDVDVEPTPSAESATDHELVWATNGERSVRELVERTLNGSNALVVTGYQDFLSAMSIILRVRPSIISDPPESIRILFGTNTDNQSRLDGSGRGLSE